MKNADIDSLRKAKNYCLLLLKFRARSEKEIIGRLKKKNYDEKVILETCRMLKAGGLVDDNRFAAEWLDYRLKNGFGIRRIKQELTLKGIDAGLIENNIAGIKDYAEEEIIDKLIKSRINRLNKIDAQTTRRRIYGFLLRRGFSPGKIIDALEQVE